MVSEVLITSSPSDAKGYVDGNYKANTPFYCQSTPDSWHEIKLTKSGYQETGMTRKWPTSGTDEEHFVLTPEEPSTGEIRFISNPDDANVYCDGDYIGETSITLDNLEEGNYAWIMTKDGYQNEAGTAHVSAGERTTVDIDLEEEEGHIHGVVKDYSTGQPILNVLVEFAGESTMTTFNGAYDITLTEGYSGIIKFSMPLAYEDYQETLTAGPGDDITLNVNMQALAGHIRGVVTEYPNGNPLENVKVSFAGNVAYTNSVGNYVLTLTEGYSGIIKFELDGYNGHQETITAGPGDDITLNVEVTLSEEPIPLIQRNSIEWESYVTKEETWYLHTLYGKKSGENFNYFVSKSVSYINPTVKIYDSIIDIMIPQDTSSGTYDAWTVLSTANLPHLINETNIIAEKLDLNAITI